jgi:hypothetical protein
LVVSSVPGSPVTVISLVMAGSAFGPYQALSALANA